jgi:hypothetical protein
VFGIIAISVSRMLNPGNRVLTVPTKNGVHRLGDRLLAMMQESARHWANLRTDPRIVAVLFHAATPGIVENEDRPYRVTYLTGMPVGPKGPAFEKLVEILTPLYEDRG